MDAAQGGAPGRRGARNPGASRLARAVLRGRGMRASLRFWQAGLALVSLVAVGCVPKVSVDDPGCAEPKPEVPPGSWCPPSYQCVDGEWVDTAGACPEPECPASKPSNGDACAVVGQSCWYEEDVPCGELEQVQAVCLESGWEVMASYCQPEPVCPDALPVVGSDCTGWYEAYWCTYPVQTTCGEQFVGVSCSLTEAGDIWVVDMALSCGACDGYAAEAECSSDPGCQWLTPGCEGEPITTGCYPTTGCDVTGCAPGLVCAEKTYNPCYGELCDACGAPYFTCDPG
jgi:hypothetical protein